MIEKNNSAFRPAVYARLSDDDGREGVSLSIENQLDIMRKYCKNNGFQTPKEFFDDDKTGTDFDRPGWKAIYAEAEAKNIDCIIINDTSRFGRNYAQSGLHFDTLVSELGIRFISLQESIDTAIPNCPALKMLPFFFVLNEYHSQTTSAKVKAVFHQMALAGKHHASLAPYGYLKSPTEKHKLILDPYASEIVKRIYEMRLQKYSYGAIVDFLNSENILAPSTYAAQTQPNKDNKPNKRLQREKWCKDGLNALFQNMVYMGDVVNEKKSVISFKNHKQVKHPVSEWVIVKDVHEPIVSREDWQECFDMMFTRIRKNKDNEILPFTGLLVCADCGRKMSHSHKYYTNKSGEKTRNDWYRCSYYAKSAKHACSSHHISENDLMEIVCGDIRAKAEWIEFDENSARKHYIKHKSDADGISQKNIEKELKQAQKRVLDLDKIIKATLEKSILSDGDFLTEYIQGYRNEKILLTEKIQKLTNKIQKLTRSTTDVDKFIILMKDCVNIAVLDRATAVQLIDKILISENDGKLREITIFYNFIGQF